MRDGLYVGRTLFPPKQLHSVKVCVMNTTEKPQFVHGEICLGYIHPIVAIYNKTQMTNTDNGVKVNNIDAAESKKISNETQNVAAAKFKIVAKLT